VWNESPENHTRGAREDQMRRVGGPGVHERCEGWGIQERRPGRHGVWGRRRGHRGNRRGGRGARAREDDKRSREDWERHPGNGGRDRGSMEATRSAKRLEECDEGRPGGHEGRERFGEGLGGQRR
jgi:hypothetical protein